MSRRNTKPTEAELEILAALWNRGAATVREIHEEITARKPTAYTTTLKVLQVMNEKGLVERDTSQRAHLYKATLDRVVTEQTFAQDLLHKVFGGSASQLIIRVLESKQSDAEELATIRRIIDEAERECGK